MWQGRNGAVSVIALAERGALFDPGPCMCGLTLPAVAESRILGIQGFWRALRPGPCMSGCMLFMPYMCRGAKALCCMRLGAEKSQCLSWKAFRHMRYQGYMHARSSVQEGSCTVIGAILCRNDAGWAVWQVHGEAGGGAACEPAYGQPAVPHRAQPARGCRRAREAAGVRLAGPGAVLQACGILCHAHLRS